MPDIVAAHNIRCAVSPHEARIAVLPESYDYRKPRTTDQFYPSLCSFTKNLLPADPQDLVTAAELIQQHRFQLEYIKHLIDRRLKLRNAEKHEFNRDNSFYWRFAMSGESFNPEIEEEAEGFYEMGELDRAEAIFTMLTDCFESYADGHWYLGRIAMNRNKSKAAIKHFEKAVELGRRLFPKRIGRKMYWADHATRPYMRGLINLAYAFMAERRFDEALALCDKLARTWTGTRERDDPQASPLGLNGHEFVKVAHGEALVFIRHPPKYHRPRATSAGRPRSMWAPSSSPRSRRSSAINVQAGTCFESRSSASSQFSRAGAPSFTQR